jgi:four helix bundle protein
MATIKNFEELDVWKLGMELCSNIYSLTNTDLFSKDYSLKDQIRRAAISVPSNISEGYEREGINQFIYFLVIAKGSCGELRTQLKIALNLKYIDEKEYNRLNDKCLSTSKQLAGFIKYLRNYKQNNKNYDSQIQTINL